MNTRYYFCVRFWILHGFITKRQCQGIGVSFPKWTNETLGNEIAFVCEDNKVLELLSTQPYFEIMKSDDVFSVSPIMEVPSNCPEVRFKRNQRIAKCFVGAKKRRLVRAKRRAEARGDKFEPVLDSTYRDVGLFHRAMIYSKSSSSNFILHIQKQDQVNDVSSDYGRYGLATNDKFQGTVPNINTL